MCSTASKLAEYREQLGIAFCRTCAQETLPHSESGRCMFCERQLVKPSPTYAQAARRYWTQGRVIAAIRQWAEDHGGRPPTRVDWLRSAGIYPSYYQVSKRYGWAEMIELAGLARPRNCAKRPRSCAKR